MRAMNSTTREPGAVPLRRTLVLPILGLHCASCAPLIEHSLRELPGVVSARFEATGERLVVELDPAQLDAERVFARVRALGYDVLTNLTDVAGTSVDDESAARSADIAEQKRLLIVGLLLTVPLVAFSMARDFGWVGFRHDLFAMLAAATVVQFWVGWRFYAGAFRSLRAGTSNMDVLIALGPRPRLRRVEGPDGIAGEVRHRAARRNRSAGER